MRQCVGVKGEQLVLGVWLIGISEARNRLNVDRAVTDLFQDQVVCVEVVYYCACDR